MKDICMKTVRTVKTMKSVSVSRRLLSDFLELVYSVFFSSFLFFNSNITESVKLPIIKNCHCAKKILAFNSAQDTERLSL